MTDSALRPAPVQGSAASTPCPDGRWAGPARRPC